MNIVQNILTYVQPLAVISFLISGICCLILKQYSFAIINLGLTIVNFFIFYGSKVFK